MGVLGPHGLVASNFSKCGLQATKSQLNLGCLLIWDSWAHPRMSGMRFSKTGTTSSPKEIWDTYWAAVRFMFKPMLVVIGFLSVIFFLTYIIFMFM